MSLQNQAKSLLDNTINFHELLITSARKINNFKKVLDFVVDCICFVDKYLPTVKLSSNDNIHQIFNELDKRSFEIYTFAMPNLEESIEAISTTSSTAGTVIYSYITDNFHHLEDNKSRIEFNNLSTKYKSLLSGPEHRENIIGFLHSLDPIAETKFIQGINNLKSLKRNEDPEGALISIRSAINLAVDSLIKLTPLTSNERGDLQHIDKLPTIARFFAKNELAKVDIILANEQFHKLQSQLSATKNAVLTYEQADALMDQAISILYLISTTVKVNPESING